MSYAQRAARAVRDSCPADCAFTAGSRPKTNGSPPRAPLKYISAAKVGLDFLPELIHRYPQIFRLIAVIRPPNSLQQTAVRKRLPLIGHQMPKQLEFFRRQMNRFRHATITERFQNRIFNPSSLWAQALSFGAVRRNAARMRASNSSMLKGFVT